MEETRILGLDSDCHSIAFGRDDGNQTCLAVGHENGEIALFTQAALRKDEGCSYKLQGHKHMVKSVAFSSNRQLLASASLDRTVRLWDTHTRECAAVLEGHSCAVYSVAFSPDNRLLASASLDRTVRLWDVAERRVAFLVAVLRGHTNYVWRVSFSPDGRQLASGSSDCTVRLWSVPEGVPGLVVQHAYPVYRVAFSPVVGRNLLASVCGGIIKLWDVGSSQIDRQLLRDIQGPPWVNDLSFSPDGSQLVSGSGDHTVRLWSVASGKLLKVLTGHSKVVNSVAFHPNGKQVVSSSYGNNVRIWTVCEWSDRTHQLFGNEMKRLVFCLMCIKEISALDKPTTSVPQLPMALWLDIFAFLC
jgi:WD40 repeat protein